KRAAEPGPVRAGVRGGGPERPHGLAGFSGTRLAGRADARLALAGLDAEQAADRVQDAFGGGDQDEDFGGGGLGEQAAQLAGIAGGLVAEQADQPGVAGGERLGRVGATVAAGAGMAGFRRRAGGEAGHQMLEATDGAVELTPELPEG